MTIIVLRNQEAAGRTRQGTFAPAQPCATRDSAQIEPTCVTGSLLFKTHCKPGAREVVTVRIRVGSGRAHRCIHRVPQAHELARIQFQAKASEDNGATGYSRTEAEADCMTGEASRVDAGRTASATSERMDVTAGETAPHSDEGIPALVAQRIEQEASNLSVAGSNPAERSTISDEEILAFLKRDRKPYREGCQHPEPGQCGAGGPGLCHACKKATAEAEAA